MYQAICPDCGATIYLPRPGDIYAGCPDCTFYGYVPPLPAPPAPTPPSAAMQALLGGKLPPLPPMSAFLSGIAPLMAQMQPDDDEAASVDDPLAARRERLLHELNQLAAEIAVTRLRAVTPDEWALSLSARYERLQAAHDALYTALGGRQMGAYTPQSAQIRAALADVLLWALLTLDGAVER